MEGTDTMKRTDRACERCGHVGGDQADGLCSSCWTITKSAPTPLRPCRYPGCETHRSADPATWPGNLGFCSAVCQAMHEVEEGNRAVLDAMYRVVTPKERKP